MHYFNTIERVQRIHKLIQQEATGCPDEFAEKFNLKKRQLYNILDEFKNYGARIRYNRMRSTFYYDNDFDVLVKISVNPVPIQEPRSFAPEVLQQIHPVPY
jgi:hypothetical protein